MTPVIEVAPAPRRIRHTKIVCTIGPASSAPEVLREMVLAGMNVVRLNFSHGAHEDHAKVVAAVRAIAKELTRPMAIIADLQGPKIRVGVVPGERQLKTGDMLTLLTKDLPEPEDLGEDELPVKLEALARSVRPGQTIMLADGTIRLLVKDVELVPGKILCLVEEGGPISTAKGVNLPDVDLDIPSITPKDVADLEFALTQHVDYVAQSFVRSPDDVERLRQLIVEKSEPGAPRPQIISKIEKPQAVACLDDIMAASDAVMVARGDLGVELGPADVPLVQKRIIRRANQMGIPVITATQMLETMTYNPEPTRAEASDVANAVLDGTSAVMLSGETAVGNWPVQAIRTLDKIARAVEPALPAPQSYLDQNRTTSVPQALAATACEIGELLDAAAIVVLTETGRTARQVSRNRPRRPVIAASRDVHACRRLALDWGTVPVLLSEYPESGDPIWTDSATAVKLSGLISPGERVVFTAGTIAGQPGMTNMLKVEEFQA
ncbi:MAG: pyruvate kinase [Thermoleophilia bacterium]|nr:pyruvate kinase [Thermoleophilia bacterium]